MLSDLMCNSCFVIATNSNCVYRLSLVANKQEFVKKLSFCRFNFGNSEIGQKLDGKVEIEEKIDGNLEMLTPPAPPLFLSTKEKF